MAHRVLDLPRRTRLPLHSLVFAPWGPGGWPTELPDRRTGAEASGSPSAHRTVGGVTVEEL